MINPPNPDPVLPGPAILTPPILTPAILTPTILEQLMSQALVEAARAQAFAEVPIGAIIARLVAAEKLSSPEDISTPPSGYVEIIGRGFNRTESDLSPVAHAEIEALRDASSRIGNWRLDDTIACITVEPCVMCLGALLNARVGTIVFGAREPKTGALGSRCNLRFAHPDIAQIRIIEGIREHDCREILQRFFAERR